MMPGIYILGIQNVHVLDGQCHLQTPSHTCGLLWPGTLNAISSLNGIYSSYLYPDDAGSATSLLSVSTPA